MARSRHIKDIDRGYRRIVTELRRGKLEAAAGYPVAKQTGAAPNGTPVWQYMAWNEEGTQSIPSRPFMAQAYDQNEERYIRMVDRSYGRVLEGKQTMRGALLRVAIEMANDIKRSILRGDFVPNAPSTIARKGSSLPLVDTGTALNAVAFDVRERSKP